jgi:hypothetical protein
MHRSGTGAYFHSNWTGMDISPAVAKPRKPLPHCDTAATATCSGAYCFVVHDGERRGADAKLVFEKHRLKGDYERRFSELLNDLGLHRPPCQNLAANNVYYLLGVLAFDILQAIKLLYLPEEHQPKRVRTLLHQLLLIPVEIKRHARQLKAVCFIGAGWIEWWKGFLSDLVPHYHLLGTG